MITGGTKAAAENVDVAAARSKKRKVLVRKINILTSTVGKLVEIRRISTEGKVQRDQKLSFFVAYCQKGVPKTCST